MASRLPNKALILATISLHRMAGGLEINIIRLANAMACRGYRVGIVTFDRPDAIAFFPINDDVSWERIGETPPHGRISWSERLRLIRRCRQAVAKYGDKATVICFHHGILIRFLLAVLFLPVAVLCSERNSLTHYTFIRARKWNLNFLTLFLVKRVVVQFPRYIIDYPRLIRHKITAIPNPVLPADVLARPSVADQQGRFLLLCAARFSHQKNLGILISAFSQLADRYPQWDLAIAGDGERRDELAKLVIVNGLENRVSLPGNSNELPQWFRRAHLFCLPSKWEGFPNALAEALAHGLPCVGYAGCAGVRDLIVQGENGILADGNGSVDSLRDALDVLFANDGMRARMGVNAVESMAAYNPGKIFARWDQLLLEVQHP